MAPKIGAHLAAFLMAAAPLPTQWLDYSTPGIPRTPDGKPDLTAPAPRARDGRPDLSGVWQVERVSEADLTRLLGKAGAVSAQAVGAVGDEPGQFGKYFGNILADFKPEEAPIRPGIAPQPRTSPCRQGGPLTASQAAPFKVIQTPGLIAVLYEAGWRFRQIYTDGRRTPADFQPLFFGYSVGHWEGDSLSVDVTGFNDKATLDAVGHPQSGALHLIERYRRRDFGHLDIEVTVDDPRTYTKPFTIKLTELLLPSSDVLEYVCEENEKDVQHISK